MKPYALIDLHCDTLTDCKYSSGLGTDTLDDPQRVLSLSSIPEGVHWAQFYAIFIPDECRGEDAIRYYEANRDNFIRQMDKFSDRVKRCRTCADMEEAFQSNRTAAFLSVENGSALPATWTGSACWQRRGSRPSPSPGTARTRSGSGHVSEHGLTDFGKKLIPELEKYNILGGRLPPERRRLRRPAGGGSEALHRHPLQRPRRGRPQAQPHRRHDPGDGAP